MNTGALQQVPAFPPVATKLLQLCGDEGTSPADLIHLLRSDPALTAEIIRYANSPLFALRTQVEALDQAVMLLGVRRMRTLALGAITRTYIKGVLLVDELRQYWRYSVACALLAERIAGVHGVREDVAYAAALLHEIGRLGLMVAYPVDYPRLLQVANSELQEGKDFDLLENERNFLGMDRYEAGEWLAHKWNLPADLRVAASRYDPRAGDEGPALLRVVVRASRIANSLGFAQVVDPRRPSYEQLREALPAEAAACLPHRAEDLRAHIEKEIEMLDWDAGTFEQERGTQILLRLEEQSSAEEDGIPPRPWSAQIWPAILAGAAILALLLGILKLAAP